MGRTENLTTKEIEMVLEIEKNIDVDKARQFFKHVMRNDQFEEDLDNSQSDLPKTLPTLLKAGYSSSSDSDSPDSSRSSEIADNSCLKELSKVLEEDGEIADNSCLKELSKVLEEDGRIRFEQTLSLFAPSPDDFTKREKGLYTQSLCAANAALAFYKEKEGTEFELVAPLLSNSVYVSAPIPDYLLHVNFLAKPKNSDSSPELFFAELVACGPSAHQVLKCCILTPRLSGYSPVAMTSDFVYIWHPEEVFCNSC